MSTILISDKTHNDNLVPVVGSDGRIDTSARTSDRLYYISRDFNEVYSWTSSFNASPNNGVFYLKNDDTRKIFINHIFLASDTDARFTIGKANGVATGTSVVGVNHSSLSGTGAYTSKGNASVGGITTAGVIAHIRIKSGFTTRVPIGGSLILDSGYAFGIIVNAACNFECTVVGGFE